MRLFDAISFDAKPAAETAPAKTSRTPLGALFQNVLQKENSSLSPFQKGEEPSQHTSLEGLLHELKQWLSNKEDGSFNEDWLNSLQHVEELNPSPDELALAEQLLQQIKELLENAALPGQSGKTADAQALPADESGTEEPKLPDLQILGQIQQLLAAIINENQPSLKTSQIAELLKQAPEFLAALQTKAGTEGLIDELKRQFFTKDPSQSQLLSMSNAELKSLKSLMEQMMNANAEPDQKEWKMAESELKAMLMSKKNDVSLSEKPLSFVLNGREIQTEGKQGQKEQPIQSSVLANQRTGTALIQGLQPAAAEESSAQPKSFSEQILSSWKQMKYTPFGRSTGSFTIRLNPENLGFITIKLVKQHGMFSSKIIASTQSAKELLEHNLAHLKQALPNMSVQIDRFGVPLQNSDQTFGQLADEQKNQHQPKQDQQKEQENEDFQEFLDELIETRSQDSEEEI
ncbi:flagellar hook-length control protein FliK [Bacillus haynesii]|uniref:flagellar hook-length control protein FliK n=1 Tax=Bacillus haynesii TaxID=1925021 RepID=UPI00227EB9B2|nr:flagellar hook-length control protein FliK [Bacillus haynesii]MCY7779466.1 flagellar hook-length control protein FliK [Bacillus haynesii]MCY7815772.1 flagellar hook-length control protein FliK [Bacillus haynesii]MCY8225392.1 flagellar hook-length control protein FliK [Bacillus haynesii]MCY8240452.1 flagellar hook-length control protein FliK [Bacillus haynesii]MCY8372109.1 flagellar hook-length control protein FliK [Bacillus haynesii]